MQNSPKGYFQKILAMDCETSGMSFEDVDPTVEQATGKSYQSVSWGFVVADAATFKPLEELYLEIKWNGVSEWSAKAESIHGLSKEYLNDNGITEEEAVIHIYDLFSRHWGPDSLIKTLGHNIASYDLYFLKALLRKFGVNYKFGNRHVDMNGIGLVCWQTYTSDQLFEAVGLLDRNKHNALEDAKMSLESARRTRILFDKVLKEI